MIRAKNYETVSKFVKVMPRILWPFSRTWCITMPELLPFEGAISCNANLWRNANFQVLGK